MTWQLLVYLVGVLMLAGILFLLKLRDRRVERREAERLRRLAEASAELVGLRDRDAVRHRVVALARELLPCERSALEPPGSAPAPAPAQHRRAMLVPLAKQPDGDTELLSVILRRRVTVADEATVTQLVESAVAALGTIRLLQQNAEALAQATQHRLETEAARREAESILSAMSDAMLTVDGDWILHYLNPRAGRLLGGTPGELRGQPLWSLLPEQRDPAFDESLHQAMAERGEVAFLSHWNASWHAPWNGHAGAKPGRPATRWLQVRAVPHPAGLAVYMQDVTQQVATEEQLRQTAKMDAIGKLTGGIAHDFNNLLTVVSGNLELLGELVPENDADVAEALDHAQRAAHSAAELTHQLLAFARRQPLSPVDTDVGRLVENLAGMLRRTLGAAITVRIRRPADLALARVDPTQLENAILNLAINARDAMPAGGTLTITLANQDEPAGIPALPEGAATRFVQVEVSDTGCGIDGEILPKVFEPFFTTKPVGSGTGLGLSMVYGFVTQSGGHAQIRSEPGQGTTVILLLPRGASAPATPSGPRGRGETLLGSDELILLVEDSPLVRRYLEVVLRNLGYRVVSAGNGAEALEELGIGDAPDLLLTDMILPGGLDGGAVAAAIRARIPELPVIFMSGFVDQGIVRDGSVDPGVVLLKKPFRRDELAARVRDAIHARLAPETAHS